MSQAATIPSLFSALLAIFNPTPVSQPARRAFNQSEKAEIALLAKRCGIFFERGATLRDQDPEDCAKEWGKLALCAEAMLDGPLESLERRIAKAGPLAAVQEVSEARWQLCGLLSLGETLDAEDPDDQQTAIAGLDEAGIALANALRLA